MAELKATRTSQDLLCAEFIFNFDDTAKDSVSGTTKTFGSTLGDNIVFDAINLPPGAQVVGGDLVAEITGAASGASPTYTLAVGTAATAGAYLGASSLLVAGRTAFTLTDPLASKGGSNVRLAVSGTIGGATAGKFRVTVLYKIDNRGGREVTPI